MFGLQDFKTFFQKMFGSWDFRTFFFRKCFGREILELFFFRKCLGREILELFFRVAPKSIRGPLVYCSVSWKLILDSSKETQLQKSFSQVWFYKCSWLGLIGLTAW